VRVLRSCYVTFPLLVVTRAFVTRVALHVVTFTLVVPSYSPGFTVSPLDVRFPALLFAVRLRFALVVTPRCAVWIRSGLRSVTFLFVAGTLHYAFGLNSLIFVYILSIFPVTVVLLPLRYIHRWVAFRVPAAFVTHVAVDVPSLR